ncbi:hypothetical protein [Paenibacillus glycanilyticus]|uniref:hypothetical protein n=1 Tax=Paenibacillus glycanilyticus TaxID=126569 RepID=UPI00295F57F2|nr:hypothetical protein [Paenibacillus glycanilyticus]
MNMLANVYRIERTNEAFRAVYDELSDVRNMNRAIIMRAGNGDESDAMQIFHDVLMRILDKDVEFGRVFHSSLKNARIDFFRKRKRERTRQRSLDAMTDESADEGAATPKVLRSDYDLEHEVLKTKEADHRQVIDFLVDPTQVDTVTTLIVTEFPKHKTVTALAKALGLHHEVVKRKLHALSRRYDANRFGDYRDYLAV